MAEWTFGPNDPAAVKIWSHRLFKQYITKTIAWKLANISSDHTSEENICQILEDTQKGPGQNITYDLVAKLSGPGVQGDAEIAGNEESLTIFTTSMNIDQLREAVKVRGAMSQQRVPIPMRETARVRIGDWWKERDNIGLINQLTGNTVQTDPKYTGLNAPTLPDIYHNQGPNIQGVIASGPRFDATLPIGTNELALQAGDLFTMDLILNLVMTSQTTQYPIRPIKLKGLEINGVLLLHPLQVRSLKRNFSNGQWGDIQKAAMNGGQITGNPIFTGAIGMYEGVVIHADASMPYGNGTERLSRNPVGVAKVARGVFCGSQAVCMAMGRAYDSPGKMKWFEELMDAGNQLRVTAGKIYGIKKNVFDSQDFATITISTYEVQ